MVSVTLVDTVAEPEVPLTVIAYVPAAALAEAERVRVVVQVAAQLDGEKVAVTPAGRPLADMETVWAVPVNSVAVTASVAADPGLTWTDDPEAESEKVKAGGGGGGGAAVVKVKSPEVAQGPRGIARENTVMVGRRGSQIGKRCGMLRDLRSIAAGRAGVAGGAVLHLGVGRLVGGPGNGRGVVSDARCRYRRDDGSLVRGDELIGADVECAALWAGDSARSRC